MMVFQAQSECHTQGSSRLDLPLRRMSGSRVCVPKAQRTVCSHRRAHTEPPPSPPSTTPPSLPELHKRKRSAILVQLVAHPTDRVIAHVHQLPLVIGFRLLVFLFPTLGSMCPSSTPTAGSDQAMAASVCQPPKHASSAALAWSCALVSKKCRSLFQGQYLVFHRDQHLRLAEVLLGGTQSVTPLHECLGRELRW